MGRLQYDRPFMILSACPSRNLGHQLKSPLMSTKVRKIHHCICTQYSHNTDIIKIEAFSHHLSTDKYLRLSLLKIFYNLLISFPCSGCIQIHPGNLIFRKTLFCILFDTLGTKPPYLYRSMPTCRTLPRYFISITAIMTNQLIISFMISKTHITMFAFGNPRTKFTFYHRSKSPPVLKQDNLLSSF